MSRNVPLYLRSVSISREHFTPKVSVKYPSAQPFSRKVLFVKRRGVIVLISVASLLYLRQPKCLEIILNAVFSTCLVRLNVIHLLLSSARSNKCCKSGRE